MAGQWYKSKANTTSSNSMSQTNVREGYRITTLEVVELIEDLTSYSQSQLLKSLRSLTLKDWLAVAKCTQLRNAQIPKYGAKVKTEDLSNTLTLILSETAQRRSSSVVSNRSTASITDKFSVTSLTELAILNDANVALVDAVHHSVIDALTMTLIEDDDDLLGTVNSHIKLRRLRALLLPEQLSPLKKRGRHSKLILDGPPLKRRKTEAADSRHAKASGGRTKKDKDLEDSDTGSDVPRPRRRDRAAARARLAERKRLGKEAQLKKTRDEEELAKAKKEKEEKEAQERKTQLDGLLDSDDYRSDSSLDIDPEDDSEDEEATTAKDLAREQKERLKALLNAKTRDGLSARVGTAIEHYAYILYFKELSSNNGGIFANAIGIGKTRAIVLAVLIGHLYPTEGERTFYCACERSLFFNAEPRQAATMMTICGFGKVDKHVFRAYNTISVTAQRTIIRKGGSHVEKRAILLPSHVTKAWALSGTPMEQGLNKILIFVSLALISLQNRKGVSNWFNATDKRDSVTGDRIYKMEDAVYYLAIAKQWRNIIANVKHDASKHKSSHNCLCLDFLSIVQNAEQQCRDILEKEGLNELEASRRIIFNCFKMQAIASYPALATLKAAQFKTYGSCKVKRFTSNSVKDLFTNLSKDYFLSIAAEDAAKAANTLPLLKEVRAKILIGSYKPIVQAVTWLGLRKKFGDESVLVMQGDRPWIMVALMAFAEVITLTEATHVVIMEPQDRQNTQDQFMFRVELELKVLGKQDVKTTS
ncbi:hypothetical protein HBI54_243630 [Parastagonospora nodorum]|nr:hypothetical protein HBI54_243630 [Parastagonospora nodorum]